MENELEAVRSNAVCCERNEHCAGELQCCKKKLAGHCCADNSCTGSGSRHESMVDHCCGGGRCSSESAMDLDQDGIEGAIALHGHAVIASECEINGKALDIAFTVGLSRRGLPELLAFALPPEKALDLLNGAAMLLSAGRLELDSGCDEIIEGMDVMFKLASRVRVKEVAIGLEEIAGVESPKVWQLVWPDRSGAFPWEANFDVALLDLQPILSEVGEY